MKRLRDSTTPSGWSPIRASVYIHDESGKLLVTGVPDDIWPGVDGDDHPHNCDHAGCQQEHVIGLGEVITVKTPVTNRVPE